MEFPISRDRLRNYKLSEAVYVETRQRVMKEIQQICKDIERIVLNTNEHKYIYRIPVYVKNPNLRLNNDIKLTNPSSIINRIIIELQNTFPDSAIVIDPLETYIIIDWS
uniref:Uncharacterized protein n=1 Tax=viral metagenome TaxID=1070528 RepID=A0A6C0EQX9_9ZZZZ